MYSRQLVYHRLSVQKFNRVVVVTFTHILIVQNFFITCKLEYETIPEASRKKLFHVQAVFLESYIHFSHVQKIIKALRVNIYSIQSIMHHMGSESFRKHFPSELHTNLANFLIVVYHKNVSQFLPSLPAPNYTRFLHTLYSFMSPSKCLPLLVNSIFYQNFHFLTSVPSSSIPVPSILVLVLIHCSLDKSLESLSSQLLSSTVIQPALRVILPQYLT